MVLFGCNHPQVMSEKELADPVEQHFNVEKGHKEDVYVCHGCADGEPGFCMNSILHPVLTATRIWEHQH